MPTRKQQTAATASHPAKPAQGTPGPEEEKSDDRSTDRMKAELMIEGGAIDVYVATLFSRGISGVIPMDEAFASLGATTAAVRGGDLAFAEGVLVAQAVALNSIFAELSRRSLGCLGPNLSAAETYLRLALKAQSQCRSTLETLALIKNPPAVFARQANINNGGQQQVNNGGAPSPPKATRAGEMKGEPNELLVEQRAHSPVPISAPTGTLDMLGSLQDGLVRLRR